MRREAERIGDILPDLQRKLKRGKGRKLDRLLKVWEEVLGPALAEVCYPVLWRSGTVHVRVTHSAALQELAGIRKREVLEKLQKSVEGEVRDLRFRMADEK